MTVAQLIEALQALPSTAQVVLPGYEEGYDNLTIVREAHVLWDHNTTPLGEKREWSEGRHSDPKEDPLSATRTVVVVE